MTTTLGLASSRMICQPRPRITWIQRKVCATREKNTEHPFDERDRSMDTECDTVVRTDAQRPRTAGDSRGSIRKLAVRRPVVLKQYRDRVA